MSTSKFNAGGNPVMDCPLDPSKGQLVQFWTPSPVTQRQGERVQDHLSAHACAKPIVAHITSTCLFHCEIQKLAQKLFQHAAEENVGERSYDAEKTCQTELREQ